MATLIRSAILSAGRVPVARPVTASFASSSRHGLDFTRPRFASTTTSNTTTTVTPAAVEEQVIDTPAASAEPDVSMQSHETPSTSNKTPQPVPTPKPRLSVNTPPTPKQHTPQFTSTPTVGSSRGAARDKKAPKVLRFETEKLRVGAGDGPLPTHTLHVKSTRNNTILCLTDNHGPLFGTVSGGSDRVFKNSQRSSYEAATQAATKMIDKIVAWNASLNSDQRPRIRVAFNGMFGMGREAVSAALSGPEGQEMRSLIMRVEDRTRIKIGGTRAPKPRRL
ncbi:hypothetical protein IAU60_004699 [Kwoniella sp. DSM 27419]